MQIWCICSTKLLTRTFIQMAVYHLRCAWEIVMGSTSPSMLILKWDRLRLPGSPREHLWNKLKTDSEWLSKSVNIARRKLRKNFLNLRRILDMKMKNRGHKWWRRLEWESIMMIRGIKLHNTNRSKWKWTKINSINSEPYKKESILRENSTWKKMKKP